MVEPSDRRLDRPVGCRNSEASRREAAARHRDAGNPSTCAGLRAEAIAIPPKA